MHAPGRALSAHARSVAAAAPVGLAFSVRAARRQLAGQGASFGLRQQRQIRDRRAQQLPSAAPAALLGPAAALVMAANRTL